MMMMMTTDRKKVMMLFLNPHSSPNLRNPPGFNIPEPSLTKHTNMASGSTVLVSILEPSLTQHASTHPRPTDFIVKPTDYIVFSTDKPFRRISELV